MKAALFQFATNAAGKVPAVFENMLALFLVNGLAKAAGMRVEDLSHPSRDAEFVSLMQVLPESEVRKAAAGVDADVSIWGSLEFKPEGSALIEGLEVTMLIAPIGDEAPVSSRHFAFDALRGDIPSAQIALEIPALEDLVQDMLVEVAEVLGYRREALDLGRIGEGLTYSDRAMVYFVYALRITQEPESKLRLYLKSISADPFFALAYTNAAQLLIGQERFGEAMRMMLRAEANLKGSNMEADVLNLLGVITMHMGMWEDALKVWRRCLELKPDHVEALCNMASAYSMRDMPAEAEELYRRALSYREDFPLAWFSLARLLARDGRFEEAEERMRTYIELCPGDPWAYNILGISLSNLGRTDEAEFILAKAIQLDPDGEAGATARRELQEMKQGS